MDAALDLQRRRSAVALAALLMLLGWAYRDTASSIAAKWFSDMSYSHGVLVLPISLWLVYRRRAELAAVEWRWSGWGIALLAVASAAWLVARAAGVLVVEQLPLVVMICAVVLALAR